jgi:hypothetical protein
MEDKPMKRHTMLMVITLILAGMLACSSGDTATVTIDTGIRKQAQLSILDKLIAWITFSQAVKADQVPTELYGNIDSIEVTISASDMGTITEEILTDTGRITLEVPAGSQRTFEVVAIDPDHRRFYGGIATVDLSAGQQVELNIKMGELVKIDYWDYDYDQQNNIFIYMSIQSLSNVNGFKIYIENNGQYVLTDTITNFSKPDPQQPDYYQFYYPGFGEEDPNAYYISGINEYGEGEKEQRVQ